MSSTVLDIKSLCQGNSNDLEPFYANWYKDFSNEITALPPSFMRRYMQIVQGTDIGRTDVCRRNLETGVAVVKFQLATRSVTRIEKKLRYSVADYLSNMGNYLNII